MNTNDIDTRQLSEIAYEKYGISIMEGRHFGSEGVNYIRINCALDKESLEEGLKGWWMHSIIFMRGDKYVVLRSFEK